ncbi:hypothetical protein M431DRAFT_484985 [Trichoderma harzianum CBS 226.95]|uniref:Uncharacterized protein n=1 Tax=Trichoderma harzianum CBS 226.95 TaxID=983964 RepID=A0A2T4A1Z7_TRIHA|nr:hypothetical protein M431DRAFT_484985 [Trichoderma harzianum CBS 226.95]PTB51092.1 hypothetical protein M431DRAFT_484985 [Trichoderma harzianum CBS 226.95]
MACWGWRGCAGSASCALANPCLIWQVAESTGRRTRDVYADMGIVKTRYTVDDSACSYSHRSWRWIKKMKQTREAKRQNCHLQVKGRFISATSLDDLSMGLAQIDIHTIGTTRRKDSSPADSTVDSDCKGASETSAVGSCCRCLTVLSVANMETMVNGMRRRLRPKYTRSESKAKTQDDAQLVRISQPAAVLSQPRRHDTGTCIAVFTVPAAGLALNRGCPDCGCEATRPLSASAGLGSGASSFFVPVSFKGRDLTSQASSAFHDPPWGSFAAVTPRLIGYVTTAAPDQAASSAHLGGTLLR